MKFKNMVICAIAVIVFPGLLFALGEKKATLEFLSSHCIEGDTIELDEICSIQCEDPYLAEKLKTVPVARTPNPGKEKTLSKYEVLSSLKKEGIQVRDIYFTGNAKIRFSFKSDTVYPEDITAAVKEYIVGETGYPEEDVIFEVTRKPQKTLVPAGELRFEVYPLSTSSFIGNAYLSVNMIVDDKIIQTVPVAMRIRLFKEVLIPKRRLERGQEICANDFDLKRREVTRFKKGVIEDFSEINEMVPKKMIRSSQVMTMNMFERPQLVNRGDIVKIVLESDALVIKTKGIALNSAKKGEVVRVENIDSKRVITAIVDGKGSARLSI